MPACRVAVDESGRHGSNLVAGGAFILGSTSLTDDEATALLTDTLGAPPQTAVEWKWHLAQSKWELRAFLDALPNSRVMAVAIHHRFFGWCKLVDTLLYEHAVVIGGAPESNETQMLTVGIAQIAWESARHIVDDLIDAWVTAVQKPSNDTFRRLRGAALDLAAGQFDDEIVGDTFRTLRDVVEDMTPAVLERLTADDHADPHVPAAGTLVFEWRKRLARDCPEGFQLVHDEIKQGDVVDRWSDIFRRLGADVSRACSTDHTSLQIADLVAGVA